MSLEGVVNGTPLGLLDPANALNERGTWEQAENAVGCAIGSSDIQRQRAFFDQVQAQSKTARKIVVTLNIGDYQPAIRALTFPLMQHYAQKIRAEFVEITERKFPDWPIVMEKFQVAEVAKRYGAEWAIFFDADALVNPECFDFTVYMDKSQVMFNGKDVSGVRSYPDQYFRRDGRNIGACDWFCISSEWNYEDLYSFPTGTLDDYLPNIFPSNEETQSGCFKDHHLIDDYILSRNIARFGLHHTTAQQVCHDIGYRNPQTGLGHNPYLWHVYNMPEAEKLTNMIQILSTPPKQGGWGIMSPKDVIDFKSAYNIK